MHELLDSFPHRVVFAFGGGVGREVLVDLFAGGSGDVGDEVGEVFGVLEFDLAVAGVGEHCASGDWEV